ncbi:hypothetical protein G3I40_25730, partial [Streptomyces sp. SID14478]|nr:hypothetical protein [Streptomyces sp. SID14478]
MPDEAKPLTAAKPDQQAAQAAAPSGAPAKDAKPAAPKDGKAAEQPRPEPAAEHPRPTPPP